MTILDKALRLVGPLARKASPIDTGAVIRSALSAAGLMAPRATGSPDAADPTCCRAPSGLGNNLDALMAGLRAKPWGAMAPVADADSRFTWHAIHGVWGDRRYKLFVPETTEPPVGLVVMLHGCTQDPDDFAAGTRMNELAAEHGLIVAYPEQTRGANAQRCWNWFNPADQARGSGEPAFIAAVTAEVAARFAVSPGRCFVAGMSAGGAMAAIMAETYPDLYAAAGIHSGLPYRSASDMGSAFAAMQGRGQRAAPTSRKDQTSVPLIIFHGDADHTVAVANADALVARLGPTEARPDIEHGRSAGGEAFTRTVARDANGRVRYEDWRIAGAGHVWSGGSKAGSYTDPAGPDASGAMVRFFLDRVVASPTLENCPEPVAS